MVQEIMMKENSGNSAHHFANFVHCFSHWTWSQKYIS